MFRTLLYFTAVVLILIPTGCSASSEDPVAANNSNNSVVVPRQSTNQNNPVFVPPVANPSPPANTNLADLKDPTQDNSKVVVLDPTKVDAGPLSRQLPENSRLIINMDPNGGVTETRLFDKHPVLVKVEKSTRGPNDSKLTIYLKNGKSVPVNEKEIGNFRTASIASLLKAAGVAENNSGKRVPSGKPKPEGDRRQ